MTTLEEERNRLADAALGEVDTRDGDDPSYALAAAAIAVAHRNENAALPPALSARVAAGAEAFFARDARALQSTTAAGAQVIVMPVASSAPAPRVDFTRWGGWVAAAACAVIVVTQAIGARTSGSAPVVEARATEHISLHAVDPERSQATADLAWEETSAHGTLHVSGLLASPPGTEYEAWIVDRGPDGDALVPVGHFAVPNRADSRAIVEVPVQAPIAITVPQRVVITIERAGGVIVSAQRPIVLEGAFAPR